MTKDMLISSSLRDLEADGPGGVRLVELEDAVMSEN